MAIIAKFRLKSSINQQFVVSTTHLLFNPKRQDIRLAQMQVLLAELDRIACHTEQHRTVPIILTGDFNIQQNSDVFRLIVGESVVPRKLFEKMNFKVGNDRKNLLPREMGISDECQHLDVVVNSNRYQTTVILKIHKYKSIRFVCIFLSFVCSCIQVHSLRHAIVRVKLFTNGSLALKR